MSLCVVTLSFKLCGGGAIRTHRPILQSLYPCSCSLPALQAGDKQAHTLCCLPGGLPETWGVFPWTEAMPADAVRRARGRGGSIQGRMGGSVRAPSLRPPAPGQGGARAGERQGRVGDASPGPVAALVRGDPRNRITPSRAVPPDWLWIPEATHCRGRVPPRS